MSSFQRNIHQKRFLLLVSLRVQQQTVCCYCRADVRRHERLFALRVLFNLAHFFARCRLNFTEFTDSVSSCVLSPPEHKIGMHKEKNNNKHLMFITNYKSSLTFDVLQTSSHGITTARSESAGLATQDEFLFDYLISTGGRCGAMMFCFKIFVMGLFPVGVQHFSLMLVVGLSFIVGFISGLI